MFYRNAALISVTMKIVLKKKQNLTSLFSRVYYY